MERPANVRRSAAVQAVWPYSPSDNLPLTKSSGVTIRNLCPNDPDNVRCCFPHYPCNIDTFPGICQDKTTTSCGISGQGYYSGLCPGNENIQCCLSETTVDALISYLRSLYNLALLYRNGDSTKRHPNQLVMEWLRHEEYASIPWVLLLGPIDSDWISFVKSKGQTMFPYDGKFADPHYCGQFVETGHLFATMNAVYLKPPLEYPFVNRGDFGGWGGDLATLFGDWLAASKLPAYNFSYDRVRGNTGSFKLLDTIEDADGFNMAMTLVSDPGSTIYEVAAEYYKPAGGYRSRFSKFFKTRFRDRDRASSLAHEMLTANGNISPTEEEGVELRALRAGAILKVAGLKNVKNLPGNLPITELQPFYDGFVDALIELTQDKGNDC